MTTKGGKRPGAGRKPLGGKPRTVRLTDDEFDAARRLGDGNASRGVRLSLDAACKPDTIVYELETD